MVLLYPVYGIRGGHAGNIRFDVSEAFAGKVANHHAY
jgi:hypothetical protein